MCLCIYIWSREQGVCVCPYDLGNSGPCRDKEARLHTRIGTHEDRKTTIVIANIQKNE